MIILHAYRRSIGLALGLAILALGPLVAGAEGPRTARGGGSGGVVDLAFSPDGARFVTSESGGVVRLWSSESWTMEREFEPRVTFGRRDLYPPNIRLTTSFSPDGRLIAIGKPKRRSTPEGTDPLRRLGGGLVDLLEVDSGRFLHRWEFPESPFPKVAVGSKWIVIFCGDYFRGTLHVRDRATGEEVARVPLTRDRGDPLNRYLHAIPRREGPPLYTVDGPRRPDGTLDGAVIPYLSLSADGRRAMIQRLVYTENGAERWNVAMIHCWDGTTTPGTFREQVLVRWLDRLALSPDGREFATIYTPPAPPGWEMPSYESHHIGAVQVCRGPKHEIQFRKFDDGSVLRTIPFQGDMVYDLAYSPDGKRLVTATRRGEVTAWDVEKCEMIQRFRGNGRGVRAVAFLPDGLRVAAGWRFPDGGGPKLLKVERETDLPLEIWENSYYHRK